MSKLPVIDAKSMEKVLVRAGAILKDIDLPVDAYTVYVNEF